MASLARVRTCDGGFKSRMLGATVFPKVTLVCILDALSHSSCISTCPALPGLTVFGFKAYAIVIYFALLDALSHLLNTTLPSSTL